VSRAWIHEVAPRDGLQNEAAVLDTQTKLELAGRLAAARPDSIELTSFVRPDLLPALAAAEQLAAAVAPAPWRAGVELYALVANARGYERFRSAELDGVTLLVSATDGHSLANVGRSVDQALEQTCALARASKADGFRVRAYVSMAFGCPYDGPPAPSRVGELAAALVEAGADVLVLADTLGVGLPGQVEELTALALALLPGERVGLHAHDSFGRAADNVRAAWRLGLRHFDAAAGGCGGCPFAPGAAGNLDTALLRSTLAAEGAETPLDAGALADASRYLVASLAEAGAGQGHPPAPPER